jgi:hypothetical protein
VIVSQVNGAYPTNNLEGNQLLLGMHCLYQEDIVARVYSVNKHTCSIDILQEQRNYAKYREDPLDNVPMAKVKAIEAYGVSMYDLDIPQIYAVMDQKHEWVLTIATDPERLDQSLAWLQRVIRDQ